MRHIRPCLPADTTALLEIINAAALAYRGVIPEDRWHEPYFTESELAKEIAAGVEFWGCEEHGQLLGVMGVQNVREVDLIRHAYVRPGRQRGGVGAALLRHLCHQSSRPMLVGTWAAAGWARDFYLRHGFVAVSPSRARELLLKYWSIPERQIDTSVVLELATRPL